MICAYRRVPGSFRGRADLRGAHRAPHADRPEKLRRPPPRTGVRGAVGRATTNHRSPTNSATVTPAPRPGKLRNPAASSKPRTIQQDRVHPYPSIPSGPIPNDRRCRVRHRRVGRLVQQPPRALQHRHDPTRRARTELLRCSHPRAATRIGAERNLGQFMIPAGHCPSKPRSVRPNMPARGQPHTLPFRWTCRGQRERRLWEAAAHGMPRPYPMTWTG